MRTQSIAGIVVAMLATPAAAVTGHFPTAANTVITASESLSPAVQAFILGAPDDVFLGLGTGWVQYDLLGHRLLDGTGVDFVVYEVDGGLQEFANVRVTVSANGVDFHQLSALVSPPSITGDEAHGSAAFRRGYDVSGAMTALGVSELRFIRLTGINLSNPPRPIGGNLGFDHDAIGLIHFSAPPSTAAIPEPASWAMLIAGFGLTGAALRRRRVGAGSARIRAPASR